MGLVQYSGLNVITIGIANRDSVVLMPGVNEIEDTNLVLLKNHPLFNQRVKDGKITLLTDVKKDESGKNDQHDMLKYIPKIFDTKLLRKIIKEDGRSQVIEAARQQLDSIVSPKKEDKESNEHFK
jgi:hypothetical protein